MAKDGKFGTFGGVFTPSLLTILGVIMYLRLPWVIGHAGLYVGLAIILVAHVVSFSTGLSISSIATDKSVGAGGPYYIVSRSLGLPIGGTLGLALFIGLSFSISLYILGFSESLLRTLDIAQTPTALRICGSLTLVVLTIITFVSTALAIKTQYLIFALIALSLLSIFSSDVAPPAVPALGPAPHGEGHEVLFAIFFPAVTGFTAGVNMSGDLKRPKHSIPRGTMLAIAVGLVVYVSLAVFLALRVDRTVLMEDPSVLRHMARFPSLVSGGIWGATLSSALGCILGAPRILQAVSVDRIAPQWFAKGYGRTNEPRNALLLAFLLGLSGIMIAELDAIARIVSMVFLTTYGFLNLSCAIESWASPDFRPDFKIPKSISVLGAATCVVVMILLDIAALAGSVALMAGLYAWLKRKQLRLDSGDTWEGFWISLIRTGLDRLSRHRHQHRNWRPNVLVFRKPTDDSSALLDFGRSLVSGSGMLTDFVVGNASMKNNAPTDKLAAPTATAPLGFFHKELVSADFSSALLGAARFHGFASLSPNTVLLDWQGPEGDVEQLAELASQMEELDHNLLLYSGRGSEAGEPARRIDLWWSQQGGNMPLNLALSRFLSSAEQYRDCELRFLIVSEDPASNDVLRTRARRLLSGARVNGSIVMLNNALESRPLVQWIRAESSDAALTVVGLAEGPAAQARRDLARLKELTILLPALLVVRSASSFAEVLGTGRSASNSLLPRSPDDSSSSIVDLELDGPIDVQKNVEELATAYEAAVSSFHVNGVARHYSANVTLLRSLRGSFERQFAQLEKGLSSNNSTKQRKLINRVQSATLYDVRKLLEVHVEGALKEQRDTLDGRIEAFLRDATLAPSPTTRQLEVVGTEAQFHVRQSDSNRLKRLKRWRRFVGFFWRRAPSYWVSLHPVEVHYRSEMFSRVLRPSVERLTADSHQLAVHLGKLLNSAETSLRLLRGLDDGQGLTAFLSEQKAQMLRHFDDLVAHQKERSNLQQVESAAQARACLHEYALDLHRLDLDRDAKKRIKRAQHASAQVAQELGDAAERWFDNQKLLFARANLGLQLSVFQHRLTTVVLREREQFESELRSGVVQATHTLIEALESLRHNAVRTTGAIARSQTQLNFEHKPQLDPESLVDRLHREAAGCAQELPGTIETLANEAIEQLEERGGKESETFQLSVKPLVLFLLESELIGMIRRDVLTWPAEERRACAMAQDVARLLVFQLSELESLTDADADDVQAQLVPAIDNGLERLRTELSRLEKRVAETVQVFEQRLEGLLASTNVYELAGAADSLDQKLRLERGRRAVSGFRGKLTQIEAQLRQLTVRALYRASAGVLAARRRSLGTGLNAARLERARHLALEHSPRTEVLEQLPVFYRQLFLGQSTLNETFWVERPAETRRIKQALGDFKTGGRGCLVIHGERGSGKSALWQYVSSHLTERLDVFRIQPVNGGSTDPADFKLALEISLGRKGAVTDLLTGLSQKSIIVLDDAELWWERSHTGFAVLDLVLSLIDRFGDNCLFVLCMNRQAFNLLCHLRPLLDRALMVVETGPMSAAALKDVIQLRHGSTGTTYEYEGKSEAQLSQWTVAKLFAAHFGYSHGLVGPALQAWLTHVNKTDKERIVIRRPHPARLHHLDDLRIEQVALLVQLCIHKQLSEPRLIRLGGGSPQQFKQDLLTLERMGLVTQVRSKVFELNRFVQPWLVERFQQRGLLN